MHSISSDKLSVFGIYNKDDLITQRSLKLLGDFILELNNKIEKNS